MVVPESCPEGAASLASQENCAGRIRSRRKYLFLECKKKEKKKRKRVQELDKPLLVRAGRGEPVGA